MQKVMQGKLTLEEQEGGYAHSAIRVGNDYVSKALEEWLTGEIAKDASIGKVFVDADEILTTYREVRITIEVLE